MARIVRLTESDLTRIVSKVLNEQPMWDVKFDPRKLDCWKGAGIKLDNLLYNVGYLHNGLYVYRTHLFKPMKTRGFSSQRGSSVAKDDVFSYSSIRQNKVTIQMQISNKGAEITFNTNPLGFDQKTRNMIFAIGDIFKRTFSKYNAYVTDSANELNGKAFIPGDFCKILPELLSSLNYFMSYLTNDKISGGYKPNKENYDISFGEKQVGSSNYSN